METNEKRCIEAAKRDPARFGPLYERYFGDIFRFLARRTAREADAADLAQQTFLKAMLALPRHRDQGAPFRAWLSPHRPQRGAHVLASSKGKVYMDLGLAETLQLMQDAELPNGERGPEGWKRPWAGYGGPSRPHRDALLRRHVVRRDRSGPRHQHRGRGQMRTHCVLRGPALIFG